jgi:adenylate cyclase
MVGQGSLHTGELLLAREHQNLCLALYDRERDGPLAFTIGVDPKQGTLSYAGWTLWNLGYPDQAVEVSNQAISAAQQLSHPNSLAAAEFFLTFVRIFRREPRLVQEGAEHVIAFSAEHGLGAWFHANCYRGWAIAQQGHYEEGIEQMRQGLAIAHAVGADIGRSHYLNSLAEAYIRTGRLEDGLSALTEALTFADEHEERVSEPETYRLKGELLLKQNNPNVKEAEICFERAIEIARKQSAKSWELRATTSLARLVDKQGRRDEARAMLAEIYDWFTEGFDTADLQDAKALLHELET